MSEVVLLGAGASIQAGVPDAVRMAHAVMALAESGTEAFGAYDFSRRDVAVPAREVLPRVHGELERWVEIQATKEAKPVTYGDYLRRYPFGLLEPDKPHAVDIEALYNAIALLADADESIVSAFLRSDGVVATDPDDLRDTLSFLKDAVIELATIASVDAVAYLKPLIGAAKSQPRFVIATLNYDNGIELAAEIGGFAVDTGMGTFWKTGKYQVAENGLVLLKLHGSVDWVLYRHRGIPEEVPVEPMFPHVVPRDKWRDRPPAVLFGGATKLDPNPPFLEVFQQFREELEDCRRLTVVGYSFRDWHVNRAILRWHLWDQRRVLRVIDPAAADEPWFWRALKTAGVHGNMHSYEYLTDQGRIQVIPKKVEELTEADLWGQSVAEPRSAE